MKRIIMISLFVGYFSVGSYGQAVSDLRQITLFSPLGNNHDSTRSAVNFETGELGVHSNQPRTEYDLKFGTLMINNDNNWFEVGDSRSRIADLGKKAWADLQETPSFPSPKLKTQPSLSPPKVVDASAGSKAISPYNQFVQAFIGHMYLMRALKGGKVSYIMFRVEKLETNFSCLLSWKAVPPPKVDIEQ